MTSILEEPAVRRVIYPLSVEFYHRAGEAGLLGEDVELLEGAIVQKMPKSPLHESVIWRLFRSLDRHLPHDCCLRKESPLTFSRSEPEPDLAAVRGSESDFWKNHPGTAEFVIEVAVTTIELDRRKAQIYASAGVKEYWIVIPQEGRVEVYRQPEGEVFQDIHTVSVPARLECAAVPGFAVELSELFPT